MLSVQEWISVAGFIMILITAVSGIRVALAHAQSFTERVEAKLGSDLESFKELLTQRMDMNSLAFLEFRKDLSKSMEEIRATLSRHESELGELRREVRFSRRQDQEKG